MIYRCIMMYLFLTLHARRSQRLGTQRPFYFPGFCWQLDPKVRALARGIELDDRGNCNWGILYTNNWINGGVNGRSSIDDGFLQLSIAMFDDTGGFPGVKNTERYVEDTW